MNRRRAIIVLLLAAGIALGALREFLFLNLNYQIDHMARHTSISYAHSIFQLWVRGTDLHALVRLKWMLAFAFIALMWLLCVMLTRVLFANSQRTLLITILFMGTGTLALLLHYASRYLQGFEIVSVELLHALQYPVMLFFLWAASFLGPASGASDTGEKRA
jgi:hypothetical protein